MSLISEESQFRPFMMDSCIENLPLLMCRSSSSCDIPRMLLHQQWHGQTLMQYKFLAQCAFIVLFPSQITLKFMLIPCAILQTKSSGIDYAHLCSALQAGRKLTDFMLQLQLPELATYAWQAYTKVNLMTYAKCSKPHQFKPLGHFRQLLALAPFCSQLPCQ